MRRVSVRELRNNTAEIVGAVRAGERVVLTVRNEPIADIVPHGGARQRFVSGEWLSQQLAEIPVDPTWLEELYESRREGGDLEDPWEKHGS